MFLGAERVQRLADDRRHDVGTAGRHAEAADLAHGGAFGHPAELLAAVLLRKAQPEQPVLGVRLVQLSRVADLVAVHAPQVLRVDLVLDELPHLVLHRPGLFVQHELVHVPSSPRGQLTIFLGDMQPDGAHE